jgi:membrane protein implicated in regulation of membrane protease activity
MKKQLRWDRPGRPIPRHPYRDTVIFYAVLASLVVGVTALTDGDVRQAIIIACALFVGATAYSWWRWRERIRTEEERE